MIETGSKKLGKKDLYTNIKDFQNELSENIQKFNEDCNSFENFENFVNGAIEFLSFYDESINEYKQDENNYYQNQTFLKKNHKSKNKNNLIQEFFVLIFVDFLFYEIPELIECFKSFSNLGKGKKFFCLNYKT